MSGWFIRHIRTENLASYAGLVDTPSLFIHHLGLEKVHTPGTRGRKIGLKVSLEGVCGSGKERAG